jgi:hypothetical protein
VVQLVFSIIQNHLPPPRNNFLKYFEVWELFLSNSGTTTKYFICNRFEGVGSVKGNYFEVGFSILERIILKWVVTKSTSDLFV